MWCGETRVRLTSPLSPHLCRSRLGDEYTEGARAVHTFYPDEFDVAGRRGAGDQGQRAGRIQPGQGVREVGGYLIVPDDHQVEVRDQGERTPALTVAMVEHD